MAVVCLSFLCLLLAGEGFSQCFTSIGCTGSQVPAATRRECCASTDEGLSYNSGGTCSVCIGMSLVPVDFTDNIRHGYLPQCLSDCVLVPIPKGSKDPSCSLNYRAVALASSVSKVL